jgi:DNA-binding NtrC family response regulator
MKTILVVDDEEKLRNLLTRIIGLEGFKVLQAGDCVSALKKLEQFDIDVVLCDVKLPDCNGVELTKTIKEKYPLTEVILLTAYGNIPDGVQAIKYGAFDYITKADDNNKIIPLLNRAVEKVELSKRVQLLEKQLGNKYSFENITGRSQSIRNAIDLAKKVANTDTTVLLAGETGTGKEVFAQAIHQASSRSKKVFLAINCSAISKDLLESIMFGHTAGSFTGATKNQKGLFEEANNGTIFLDEIGEMALDLQAKLLRVIETGEFIKVGETKPTKVNVRIIAASHRDLIEEVSLGNFREDLYYRVSVFQILLPPLRERVEDIEALANFFVEIFSAQTNKKVSVISADCLKILRNHKWKGNIRELKNVIERSVILTEGATITPNSLPIEMQQEDDEPSLGNELSEFNLANAEKKHIQKILQQVKGNKTEAARLLNVAVSTLYRKLKEYNI